MDNGLQRNEWIMLERFLKDVPLKGVGNPAALLEWFMDNEMILPEAVYEKHSWIIDRLKHKCGFFVKIKKGAARALRPKETSMATQLRNRAREVILNAQIPAL